MTGIVFIFDFLIYGKTPSFRWVKKEKFQGNPKIRITILTINSAKVYPTLLFETFKNTD